MKKKPLILAACMVAFASSCQPQKPMQAEKKEMKDDSNYHDRRTKKECGSCNADKAAEPAKVTSIPEVKMEEKKVSEVELKAAPAVKVEKTETAATPEVKVEKAN